MFRGNQNPAPAEEPEETEFIPDESDESDEPDEPIIAKPTVSDELRDRLAARKGDIGAIRDRNARANFGWQHRSALERGQKDYDDRRRQMLDKLKQDKYAAWENDPDALPPVIGVNALTDDDLEEDMPPELRRDNRPQSTIPRRLPRTGMTDDPTKGLQLDRRPEFMRKEHHFLESLRSMSGKRPNPSKLW